MGSNVRPENSLRSCCGTPLVGVIVSGCSGRMGRRLLSLVIADPQLRLLGGICPSAARHLSCKTRPEALLKKVCKEGLRQKDPLAADYLKASHFVPEFRLPASNTTQLSQAAHKNIEMENDAPICTSLGELLALPELTQESENPRIVVDFSHPAGALFAGFASEALLLHLPNYPFPGTMALLQDCVRLHVPAVVGTTGFSVEQKRTLEGVAREIPLCVAANFALGMNLLIKLVGEATTALGDQYDIEIVEAHHRLKADAPSGTALSLLDSIANAKQLSKLTNTFANQNGNAPVASEKQKASEGSSDGEHSGAYPIPLVHGRLGAEAKRKKGEVGVHSLRLGNVVGEHSVIYASIHEKLVLQHHAESRDVFAAGALQMVKWIASKPKGAYSVNDMFCAKSPASHNDCRT